MAFKYVWVSLWLSVSLLSQVGFSHGIDTKGLLYGLIAKPTPPGSTVDFYGLRFTIDPGKTSCVRTNDVLTCTMTVRTNAGSKGLSLVLTSFRHSHGISPPMLRLARKERWVKQYPSLNQCVEEERNIGAFASSLEMCRYFKMNNIFWPVLLRAFDVVMDKTTAISVVTVCDADHWPLFEKELDSIERSFIRAYGK